MPLVVPFTKEADEFEQNLWRTTYIQTPWDMAKTQAQRSFESSTTTGLALEEIDIRQQETNVFMSEDAWKESAWFDERIEWNEGFTETRGRILSENRIKDDNADWLLSRSTQGVGRTSLSFVASLVSQVPDITNLIPYTWVGRVAKTASIGAKALSGAKAGVVSTLLTDAVIMPIANRRGEDFGIADLVLDATFGAVLGAGAGALMGGISKSRSNTFKKDFANEQLDLADTFAAEGMYTKEQSRKMSADIFNELSYMPQRNEAVTQIRRNSFGKTRTYVAKALDGAINSAIKLETFDMSTVNRALDIKVDFEKVMGLNKKLNFDEASVKRLSEETVPAHMQRYIPAGKDNVRILWDTVSQKGYVAKLNRNTKEWAIDDKADIMKYKDLMPDFLDFSDVPPVRATSNERALLSVDEPVSTQIDADNFEYDNAINQKLLDDVDIKEVEAIDTDIKKIQHKQKVVDEAAACLWGTSNV